jgi:hypothetical protein
VVLKKVFGAQHPDQVTADRTCGICRVTNSSERVMDDHMAAIRKAVALGAHYSFLVRLGPRNRVVVVSIPDKISAGIPRLSNPVSVFIHDDLMENITAEDHDTERLLRNGIAVEDVVSIRGDVPRARTGSPSRAATTGKALTFASGSFLSLPAPRVSVTIPS